MKKGLKIGAASLAALMVFGTIGCSCKKDEEPATVQLPAARLTTGECTADTYDLKCSSITSENLATYYNRSDVRYVDLRNASDYSKSHLQKFENVEFFKYIYGETDQLFIKSAGADNYAPRYEDSVEILEQLFPKNQTIFFMCASGGRVVHMMKIMEINGWDMTKIYNVGGMQQYSESTYRVDADTTASDKTAVTTPIATSTSTDTTKYIAELPDARKSTCDANDYSLNCSNITSENLATYYNRTDVRYVDLRNDSDYSASHLQKFENVEFFKYIYGDGDQLFIKSNGDDNYTARYTDSVEILEQLFPKDQTIFFMCASGGRVVHMMKIMEKYGWNMNNVYNVGGMQQYSESTYRVDADTTTSEKVALTYKTGTDTSTAFGHTYTTTVKVAMKDNKIYAIGVSGEVSDSDTWTSASTWNNQKYAYLRGLIGKSASDIDTMLGSETTASGNDVVTGATLSSNRVLKAIKNALAA